MSDKLLLLNRYLAEVNLEKEADEVLGLLTAASSTGDRAATFRMPPSAVDTVVIPPASETVIRRKQRAIAWPSERALRRYNIEPIKYLAGTEAASRGEGKLSKEGDIYEVLYDGERAVAKIVPAANREPDTWKKILSLDIPDEYRRHLPKIYKIIEDNTYSVIVMEVLLPAEGHMAGVLSGKVGRDPDFINKNNDFLHEVIQESFESAINTALSYLGESYEDRQLYDAVMFSKVPLGRAISGAAFLNGLESDRTESLARAEVQKILSNLDLDNPAFVENFTKSMQERIQSYLKVSRQPVAKYYGEKSLDRTISLTTHPEKLKHLEDERENLTYENSPEKFLFSEKHLEETRGLYALLGIMKKNGIEWADLHSGNLMIRPGTRDLVLIDVGLYDIV